MTPEQMDAEHTPEPMAGDIVWCKTDRVRWPCLWEQRRRQLEAALRVVAAARVYIQESENRPYGEPSKHEAEAWRALATVLEQQQP